jgi:predicted nucleotidyltransferase
MAPQIQSILAQNTSQVAKLCQDLAVNELRLFGSAATGSYHPETSDVDIVVDFRDHDQPGIADRYMTLADGLEKIFRRPVDLLTGQSIRNPHFRRIIEETSQPIYAA